MRSRIEPIRVLVVDYNVDAAEILGILLSGNGFVAKVECDKASVSRTAQSFLPRAVIIDLGSDSMDTYEVAIAIRMIPELETVYLITLSKGRLPTPLRQDDVRIDAPLTKPSGYRVLIGILERRFAR